MQTQEVISLIITLPSDSDWSAYSEELLRAAAGETMNFKVSSFPKQVGIGDRCYVVYKGMIKGWMSITGFSEKEFVCSTTGKRYKGKFIERSGPFHKLDEEIPYTGFQGYRYFNLNSYKEELRQKAYEEMFDDRYFTDSRDLLFEDIENCNDVKRPSKKEQLIELIKNTPKVNIEDTVIDEIDPKYFENIDDRSVLFIAYHYNPDIFEDSNVNVYEIDKVAKERYEDIYKLFSTLDAFNVEICILTTSHTTNERILQLIKDLSSFGYFLGKFARMKDGLVFYFEPDAQENIRDSIDAKILYHITPEYNRDEILRKGFEIRQASRSETSGYMHPPRVYFFYRPDKETRTIRDTLKYNMMLFDSEIKDSRYNGNFTIFVISVDNIPDDIEFYQDPRNRGSLYVTKSIPKEAIIQVNKAHI